MKKKHPWIKKLEFHRYKRRVGAKEVTEELKKQTEDLESLKNTLITVTKPTDYRYRYFKNLNEHLAYLETEFSGQSAILFYHAKLIVLIRRESNVKENMQRFEELWRQQADFLLTQLSMRWIVSAIDTFIDYSEDALLKSMLFSGLLLVNTVKIYETERYYLETDATNETHYVQNRLENPTSPMLFDGIPAVRINYSDSIRNMRYRMLEVIKLHPLGGKILNHIFLSLHDDNTAFHRFKNLNTDTHTQWWFSD